MVWLLFVVLSTAGSYPIATVTEVSSHEECEKRGVAALKFNPENTKWYCAERK